MALQKIEHNTFFQRIKNTLLGKVKPNILTRFSVITGFIIWLYFSTIYALTLVSILLMSTLKNEKYLRAAYEDIGLRQYGYMETIERLTLFSSVQLGILSIVVVGLIFIWRQKKIGFLLYIFANIALLFCPYLIMGYDYFSIEFGYVNLILVGSVILYFTGGLFLFNRKRNKAN